MLLGTITIDHINLTLNIGNFIELIIIALTALFTAKAASAAMKSANISQNQFSQNLARANQTEFFSLLNAVEASFNIRFIQRGALYHELSSNVLFKEYKRLSGEYNATLERVYQSDNKTNNVVFSSDLYESYFDYVVEICNLVKFDFIIRDDSDYVEIGVNDLKLPTSKEDSFSTIEAADLICSEIIGYNHPELHELGLGVINRSSSNYFEAFYYKYKDRTDSHYKYIEKVKSTK